MMNIGRTSSCKKKSIVNTHANPISKLSQLSLEHCTSDTLSQRCHPAAVCRLDRGSDPGRALMTFTGVGCRLQICRSLAGQWFNSTFEAFFFSSGLYVEWDMRAARPELYVEWDMRAARPRFISETGTRGVGGPLERNLRMRLAPRRLKTGMGAIPMMRTMRRHA